MVLWSAAVTKGYACPFRPTFRQALEPRRPCRERREQRTGRIREFHHPHRDGAKGKAQVIRHDGTRTYYAEYPDYVQMPPFETFGDLESYATTLGH